mgnify:CR=1 FL=1
MGLPLLAEELGLPVSLHVARGQPLRLVDVGSGAGFPGLPLKIAAPHLDVTLMDGTQKKVHFLQEIICLLYTSPSPRDRTRSRMQTYA